MKMSNKNLSDSFEKHQRQHEILIALISQQDDLELMESESVSFDSNVLADNHPAKWIERNKRVLNKYQALVRSAITLENILSDEF